MNDEELVNILEGLTDEQIIMVFMSMVEICSRIEGLLEKIEAIIF